MNRSGDGPGHTFVVNGVLEGFGWDAAVIPTDSGFVVSDYWRDAAGLRPGDPWSDLRPAGWGARSVARGGLTGRDAAPLVWFIDVAGTPTEDIGDEAARSVRQIADADGAAIRVSAAKAKRHKPLIAVPVIGVGRGGHGSDRGVVIRQLLEKVSRAAQECRVDVVLVARSSADYAAFQHLRGDTVRNSGTFDPLRGELVRAAQRLGSMAARGELALFIGAGVSMSAGLPSWTGLIAELSSAPDAMKALEGIDLKAHGPLEQATLLERAAGSAEVLDAQIATIIKRTTTPGLSHVLLAGLGCREVVTTNYDTLYEQAADSRRPDGAEKVVVSPWARASGDDPWILKMHGDVGHPGSTVLTRESFVRYDARWKPVGSIIQSLMMTRHLLVVGASMTDDNLVRFAHEVGELRDSLHEGRVTEGGPTSGIGTIVTLAEDAALEMLWKDRFAVVGAAPVPAPAPRRSDEAAATHGAYAARELAIFLDALGVFAAESASYLLSPKYPPTTEEGRALAAGVQRLAPQLAVLAADEPGSGWAELASALASFGLEVPDALTVSAVPSPRGGP